MAVAERGQVWADANVPVTVLRAGWGARYLVNTEGLQVAENFVEAGAVTKDGMHTHGDSQAHYVVRGKFEFRLGDEVRVLGPGGCMLAPAGTPHDVTCLETGSYVIVKTKP
jgi:quercetin dioxygenase-like cupin family protein